MGGGSSKEETKAKSQSTATSKRPKKRKQPKKRKPKPIDLKEVKFKLHIAIDFGTDGCGIGFAHNNEVKIYNKWRGQQTKANTKKSCKTKTKTQLVLDDNGNVSCFGNAAKFLYCNLSNDGKRNKKFFERFKMALYDNSLSRPRIVQADDEKQREVVDTAKYLHSSNGKRVESEIVFIAAFKELQKLALEFIPINVTKENIMDEEIQWVLTVPAIWSQKAKNKMREWIIKAGLVKANVLNQCLIVYEPDCASLAIQKEYFRVLSRKSQSLTYNPTDVPQQEDEKKQENKNPKFEAGDKYILVDAGGGTVDIACHKILDDGCVEEIVFPTGDKWGSCYVDDLFIELLGDIFSKQWIDAFRENYSSGYVELLESFENAKTTFYKNKATKHRVQLPDDFMGFVTDYCEEENITVEQKIKQYTESKQLKYFIRLFSNKDVETYNDEGMDDGNMCLIELIKENVDVDCDDDSEDYDDESDDDAETIEFLEMDISIWKCLFDSKINNIILHIKKLLAMDSLKDCKFLGLVGGFSCSKYFQFRIKDIFGSNSSYDLNIIIPRKPMLSVVTGAAWMAVTEDYIRARKLKHTYGILVRTDKQNAKARGISDNYIKNNKHGANGVTGCFHVLATKNERIAINDVKEFIGYSTGSTANIEIYSSDQMRPKTKDDGIELAAFTVPTFASGKGVVVEFHFYGTLFTVLAFATDHPENKKTAPVNYVN